MKTRRLNVLITACMFSTAVCTTTAFAQKDAKKVAINENEEKFDDSKLEKDAKFVVMAADAGQFEVMASELAKRKSSTQMVKDLADQLIQDHAKANAELKGVAMKHNITIPEKLGDKLQRKFDNLNEETEDFDREYTKVIVSSHKDAIDLFENQAARGEIEEIRTWASKRIATLKQHLEMAENVSEAVREMSSK